MSELSQRKCVPCEGGIKALDRPTAEKLLKQLGSQWKLSADGKQVLVSRGTISRDALLLKGF